MWGGDGGGSFSKRADLTVKNFFHAQKTHFSVWLQSQNSPTRGGKGVWVLVVKFGGEAVGSGSYSKFGGKL